MSAKLGQVLGLLAALLLVSSLGCSGKGEPQEGDRGGGQDSGTGGAGTPPVEAFASVIIAPPEERRLSRIEVVPRFALVPAGETMVFSAIAYDEAARPTDARDLEVRWSMKDLQAGTITRRGVFRAGLQTGVFNSAVEVVVTRRVGDQAVTLQTLASVSVTRPLAQHDISRVYVLPEEVQVEPGATMELAALALDRDGVSIPDVVFTWEMVVPEAGSVDRQGRFTSGSDPGYFPGAIRVAGQKRGDTIRTAVSLVPVEVRRGDVGQSPTKVNLYPQAVTLRPGDTIEFRALVLDQRGRVHPQAETSWSLKDPGAGTLDNRGRFRAGLQPGTYPNLVEVTVVPQGSPPVRLKASATVTVVKAVEQPTRLEQLVLTQQLVRLRPQESMQMTVTALSRRGQVIASPNLTWTAPEALARVSPAGRVTAVGEPGVYQDALVVTASEGAGAERVTLTAKGTLIILGPLARVEVVPREVRVAPRQMIQFIYVAYDVNGVRLFDTQARWEMVDPKVGTIDNAGLFVAGERLGEYGDVIRLKVTQPVPRERRGS